MTGPYITEPHAAEVRPIRTGLEFCFRITLVDVEGPVHLFRIEHMLQDRLVMRPARVSFESNMLGHEPAFNKLRDRHLRLLRWIDLLQWKQVIPGNALRLFFRQPTGLHCRTNADRTERMTLFAAFCIA